jgi:hypothetical protein
MARASAAIDSAVEGTGAPAEGDAVIETVAGPVKARAAEPEAEPAEGEPAETATSEQEGEIVGEPAEAEKGRAERIEQAVRKAKASANAARRMKAQIAEQNQMLSAERQRTQQFAQQAQRAQQIEAAFRADPLKAAEQFGITPERLAQAVTLANTPEEKFAILQKQVEAERNERLRLQQSIQAEKQARVDEGLKSAYIKTAGNVEKYPNLKGLPGDTLISLGLEVARKAEESYLRRTGVRVKATDEQILRYLNDKTFAREAPAETPKASATAAPSKAKSKTTGTASTKPASPRTVTSSQTAGSFNRPANFGDLPRAQRMAMLRSEFK